MHNHDHHHEDGYTHEEINKLAYGSDEERLEDLYSYFDSKFEHYVYKLSHLLEEEYENVNIPEIVADAKDNISEEQLRVLVVFAAIKKVMANPNGAELMDVAAYIIEKLEEASLSNPINTDLINSIFNFNVIYTVLFSLLDLAENGRYQGKVMSSDYRLGVIDSIVALRKYQSTSGFGIRDWEYDYNPAAEKHFKSEE